MNKGLLSRLIIHEILLTLKKNLYTYEDIFTKKIKEYGLGQVEKKFIHNVTLTSLRNNFIIKEIINIYSNKKKITTNQYLILLSGINQIVFLNIKEYAVLFTMVELSKKKGFESDPSLTNAILRKVVKNKKNLKLKKTKFDLLPTWFKLSVNDWNDNTKINFLDSIRLQPELNIVFKKEEDFKKFKIEGINTSLKSVSLNSFENIRELPDYKKGTWWVQDYSAMLPISLLNNISNKRIVDMCCAPGGKAFQILAQNKNLFMYEINHKRAEILKLNLQRLNYKTEIYVEDSLKINEGEKYDIVLLDAPCTSIGTIRRNPEIFFRDSNINVSYYTNLQKQLLEKASKLVKKNGFILYMVCSFLKSETNQQVNKFIKKNKNFTIDPFEVEKNLLINKKGILKTIPQKFKNKFLIDGFFAVKIIRNE
jgi:16S rRNA (cytosine967-C5)-methyltransferase